MLRAVPIAFLLLVLAGASPAAAQPLPDDPPPQGVKASVLFVPGIHFIEGVFGDDTPRGRATIGVSLGARFCVAGEGPVAFITDATVFPCPIRKPHFDESVHPVHLDAGARFARGTYFRFGVGFSIHFWSGQRASEKLSPALTATIAVGREMTAGTRSV